MDQENIMFFGNDDKSYIMVDLYLNDTFLGYKDFYNYYDIDVNKVLLFKKSDNEYIIRYKDVNILIIGPLQLKIDNFCIEICKNANNNIIAYIYGDDKKLFKKCREIWNNSTESIGINNAENFVKTTEDNDDEYIEAVLNKNTSFVKVIVKIKMNL